MEKQWLVLIVFLHQTGVLESGNHRVLALNSSESYGADFLRVKAPPFLPLKVFDEGRDELGVQEIDETVANIALVLEINRKIEEVISATVRNVHFIEQHLLAVFVGNIPNHDGRPSLTAV